MMDSDDGTAAAAAGDAIHRSVAGLQGGNLKITVSASPKPGGSSRSSSASFAGTGTQSIGATLFEKLEQEYLKNRREIVMEDGFISTPLHALKKMAEAFKTPLHSEMFVINLPDRQTWRVEVLVGKARGVGQSPRRQLSFQMAALDVLEKVKASNKELELQTYGFLPGWRTGIKVFRELNQFCYINTFPTPKYTVLPSIAFEEGPQFGVECRIGELVEIARSDDRFLAKRIAARQMYDKLSGNTYPDDDVYIGNQCISLKELKELGIYTLSSSWKKQWMMENRVAGNQIYVLEDEPDDGDFADFEELFEENMEQPVLPEKGQPTGFTRVVKNEKAEPSAATADDDDMEA